jgi:hypothetical protein
MKDHYGYQRHSDNIGQDRAGQGYLDSYVEG